MTQRASTNNANPSGAMPPDFTAAEDVAREFPRPDCPRELHVLEALGVGLTTGERLDRVAGAVGRAAKPSALKYKAAEVPVELRALTRWVVWDYRWDGTRWTKTPINARTGGGAMTNNPATWAPYASAEAALLEDSTLAGLGFNLGDGWVGIDLDNCVDWINGFSPLAKKILATVQGYAEISPSGKGVKIITRGEIPHSKADHAKGLEVYDRQRYFAITGHAIAGRDNTIPATPIDFTAFYAEHFGASAPLAADHELRALTNAKSPLVGWPLERVVEELLPHLDPCAIHYNEWLEVGAALHHQSDGDEESLEAWDAWSAQDSERWHEGGCAEKWATFGLHLAGHGPTTLATLFLRVKEARAKKKYDRAAHWSTQIALATDERQLTETLPGLVAQDLLVDDTLREKLAQQLQKRIKAVTGTRYTLRRVRRWFKLDTSLALAAGTPAWLKPYVYVSDQDKFFDAERRLPLTRESFNAHHNRDMPKNDAGNPIKSAALGATDLFNIPGSR